MSSLRTAFRPSLRSALLRAVPRSLGTACAVAALSAGALAAAAAPARAQLPGQVQAFTVSGPLAGNQAFGGAFGIDFDVGDAPVLVRALGAFDDGQDGLNAPIRVWLYDRDLQTALASTTFGIGADARLGGGYRFQDLVTALLLPAGFHGSIVASGYGTAGERLHNSGAYGFPGTVATGGLLTFVGGGRYSLDADGFPTTVDGPPAVHYAGGNFTFTAGDGVEVPATTTPEPETWMLLGGGVLAVGAWRRKVSHAGRLTRGG